MLLLSVANFSVGAGRFELPTSRTRTVRATKLRYAPEILNWWRRRMAPDRGSVKAPKTDARGSEVGFLADHATLLRSNWWVRGNATVERTGVRATWRGERARSVGARATVPKPMKSVEWR